MFKMNECRCVFCGRYLFSFDIVNGEAKVTIKCKSCNNINAFDFKKVILTVSNYAFAEMVG